MRFDRASGAGYERGDDQIVATLRRELLVPFDDDIAGRHLEAMLLEFDWELVAARRDRRGRSRARTVMLAGLLAGMLSVTSGLAAAGALPASAQHWLSKATSIVGIHLPDRPARRTNSVPTTPLAPTSSTDAPRGSVTDPTVNVPASIAPTRGSVPPQRPDSGARNPSPHAPPAVRAPTATPKPSSAPGNDDPGEPKGVAKGKKVSKASAKSHAGGNGNGKVNSGSKSNGKAKSTKAEKGNAAVEARPGAGDE